MRKRISMFVALALMLVAAMALSGVAQAASPGAPCKKLAIQTLGKDIKSANYTFIGGTAGDDNFTGKATAGSDVFCGFGGNDSIHTLDQGDIFLGGVGDDSVYGTGPDTSVVAGNYGTFNGEAGNDTVLNNFGTFNGGDGNDSVASASSFILTINDGTFNGGAGDDYVYLNYGTFNGEAGNDSVTGYNTGVDFSATFNGGEGNDYVEVNDATFNGGAGDDRVVYNSAYVYGELTFSATFNGGDGNDTVNENYGTINSVELGNV